MEGLIDLEHHLLAVGPVVVALGEVGMIAASEFKIDALDFGRDCRAFFGLVDAATVASAAESGVGGGPVVVLRIGRLWRWTRLAAEAGDAAFAEADGAANVIQLGEHGGKPDLGFGGEAVEIVGQIGKLGLQFGDDAAARLDLKEGMSVGAIFGGKDADKRGGTGQGRHSSTGIDAGRRAAVRWHTIDHTPGTGQNLPPAVKSLRRFLQPTEQTSTGSRGRAIRHYRTDWTVSPGERR